MIIMVINKHSFLNNILMSVKNLVCARMCVCVDKQHLLVEWKQGAEAWTNLHRKTDKSFLECRQLLNIPTVVENEEEDDM